MGKHKNSTDINKVHQEETGETTIHAEHSHENKTDKYVLKSTDEDGKHEHDKENDQTKKRRNNMKNKISSTLTGLALLITSVFALAATANADTTIEDVTLKEKPDTITIASTANTSKVENEFKSQTFTDKTGGGKQLDDQSGSTTITEITATTKYKKSSYSKSDGTLAGVTKSKSLTDTNESSTFAGETCKNT